MGRAKQLFDKQGSHLFHHFSQGVVLTLAHILYRDEEEKAAAIEMACLIFAAGRCVFQELRKQPALYLQ